MELQLAKAEKMVALWGIPPRRLKLWLDEGLITYKQQGLGRGSMRLLTDESLLDAYLVLHLSHDLVPAAVRSCVRAARPFYAQWLSGAHKGKPSAVEIVFKMDHAPQHRTEVRLPLQSALVSIRAVQERSGKPPVTRGRKPRGWRDVFGEDLATIGKSLRTHGRLTPEALRASVRAYRARRLTRPQEVHVAVPPETT